MATEIQEFFLHLLRLGIGVESEMVVPERIDWPALHALAEQQGLSGILLDGIETLSDCHRPARGSLLHLIGETLQREATFDVQRKAAADMAQLFKSNGIRTYVLKGDVVAECYPKPERRVSVDLDCYLLPDMGDSDVWTRGNDLIRDAGYKVSLDYYKNSTFFLPGLTVENHRYFTPFRGNKRLKALERMLQALMAKDGGEDRFEGTWLCRPPVMVSALFLIEHAYSHFLHEGLTWRLVLDWMMFSRKHKGEITWRDLGALIDEFGFRKFYESYVKLGRYLLGEIPEEAMDQRDMRMLEDIWAPLDLHESVRGFKGKLALAGNTWRARWKYRYFSEISMLHALWIQVKGVVFDKEPKI